MTKYLADGFGGDAVGNTNYDGMDWRKRLSTPSVSGTVTALVGLVAAELTPFWQPEPFLTHPSQSL